MDNHAPYSQIANAQTAQSSTSSVNLSSPTTSTFSKGHSSRGSNSSSTSSPIPRESLDMYGAPKRLEDVTEDPQERDEFEGYTVVNDKMYDWNDYDKPFSSHHGQPSPPSSPGRPQYEWSLRDNEDDWHSPAAAGLGLFKRRKSMEHPTTVHRHRFSTRFGSISRRWKNRSAPGPQLSIATHIDSPISRSGSFKSSQVCSPAMSIISKRESLVPSSPVIPETSEVSFEPATSPVEIEQKPSEEEEEEEPCQATTPLLPPILTDIGKEDEPVHSPLQSPAIAPTSAVMSSRASIEGSLSCLPSPPLSTKPSMVSMHARSRTNTMTSSPYGDVPTMQLLDDLSDPWAVRLGHANFTIYPEPYVPETIDLESYTDFRNNWDQARTNYAKHITRTAEHYGSTSKVYKLTEEKWASIDEIWKKQHTLMRNVLAPVLARLSSGESSDALQDSVASSTVLENPSTKMVLPVIDDKSGKFPELGDGEIVGPMSVARPRGMTGPATKGAEPRSPPLSPHKRNLLKIISDIFKT
ncbi:hypothetical protein HRR83_006665 [Exophiala dermatitidis]|uniref:Only prolin and serin are matching in the corresponding protein n=2 Tax=Exophiala dermatitidis TaxID=5970 RepID=H6BVS7_EXODN|nr:uncharacterized protein HMPREF1120_04062 [Exophiala dermatitidis NIH/UT8656]KAJ4511413.1 hypothetical protein HRR75_005339 [Exophiala dermatitidis]EHY55953.1 hypothetical protein HMPREF1120_04062 [Exophiala dermatitidis NIH/UT8656]KAJ4514166.1 hypothetical protein HRR74_005825 [Exophiala dermatitidis]KAJ4515350.1 hypothetical protein HRR73_005181 [Exophiala dermatitidis]KAJ4533815.1 hypothetical protein HRR77_008299 [Exophiala dermatitidis]